MWGRKGSAGTGASFFARFRRDVRGNTLAMMAIALIPLSAMAGSAVDMGRLYVVKVRLQQACDAGVLAGRKNMVSSGSSLDSAAVTQANTFFRNNFREGWMNTSAVAFTPSKTADNQVAGTATAKVPMSIMKMFAMPDITLNLACEARYDVADTDVMFVLDTTGSMACSPQDSTTDCSNYVGAAGTTTYSRPADGASGNTSTAGYPGSTGYYVPEKSDSRIKALREAVLSFYDTLDTVKDPTTNVRYGFVTYTSTVNAGRAIMDRSASYMIGGSGSAQWNYQSRKQNGEATSNSTATNSANTATCATYNQPRTPATGYDNSTGSPGPKATSVSAARSNNSCVIVTTTYLPKWEYKQVPWDVSNYVSGVAVDDPTRVGASLTSRWLGCIEERDTTAGVSSFTTDNLPPDLDPDLIPSSTATRWRPMWPDVVYDRYFDPDSTSGDDTTYRPSLSSTTRLQQGYVSCGKPVKRLGVMARSAVSAYVNASDFRAIGGTYHDTGMIWGTRMLSRTGIFGSDNDAWAGRQPPNRVLIFMTDGDMSPNQNIYGMYGFEQYDKRVTNGDYGNSDTYKNYHNQRFLAECSKAKSMGIDVWVVAVGQAVTAELTACASSADQAVYAGTSSDVSEAFSNIAKHVGALRISK